MPQTDPACLTLARQPTRRAAPRPARISTADAVLVALAFGFVTALTIVGGGPSPAPAALVSAAVAD